MHRRGQHWYSLQVGGQRLKPQSYMQLDMACRNSWCTRYQNPQHMYRCGNWVRYLLLRMGVTYKGRLVNQCRKSTYYSDKCPRQACTIKAISTWRSKLAKLISWERLNLNIQQVDYFSNSAQHSMNQARPSSKCGYFLVCVYLA